MNIDFWTADLHLNHKNIPLYQKGRSFCLIENEKYDPNKDFHITKNNPKKANMELHNQVIIDKWNSQVGKKDTVAVLGDFAYSNYLHFLNRLNGKIILIQGNHDRLSKTEYKHFTKVCDTLYVKLSKEYQIFMSHYPHYIWRNSCYGSWHLYGHVHGSCILENKLAIDVGYDCWGQLLNFEIIKSKMEYIFNRYGDSVYDRADSDIIESHYKFNQTFLV